MKRNLKIVIWIIGVVVIPVAVFLFGTGVLQKSEKKQVVEKQVVEEKKQIFCGIEQTELTIPSSLMDEMKSIPGLHDQIGINNIFVRNDSRSVCTNPIITINLMSIILGYVVNETNEDKMEIEKSISIRDGWNLILKLNRLGPNSFVDFTVWINSRYILDEKCISFSSDSDFEIKTKLIWYPTNEEKFR